MFTVHDAIVGGSVLRQITNHSTRSGAVIRRSRASGAVATTHMYGVKMEQVTTLSSGDIAGLIAMNSGNFVSTGLAVLDGTIVAPFKNRANGGEFAGDLSHTQISGANALVVPASFEAQQDSEQGAAAAVEIHWISADGRTASTQTSTGNTLATAVIANGEFALGPVDLNGTDLESVTGVRINPGITVIKRSSKGGIWPNRIAIQTRDPSIDITVDDINEVASLTDGFTTVSSLESFLQRRVDGGEYAAPESAVHARFSFAGGIAHSDSIEARDNGNGTTTVRIEGKALAASAASAIT